MMLALLFRVFQGLKRRWRNVYYKFLGVQIEGYAWLGQVKIPRNFMDIKLTQGCSIDDGVVLLSSGERSSREQKDSYKITIGKSTYINRYSFIDAAISITIGEQCAIGPNCYITDHDHGMEPGVPPLEQLLVSAPTCICDRAWLGANVTILKGVTIGEDAVIGAGSVVTKDIPAGAITVGVPAKVIKFKSGFAPFASVNQTASQP